VRWRFTYVRDDIWVKLVEGEKKTYELYDTHKRILVFESGTGQWYTSNGAKQCMAEHVRAQLHRKYGTYDEGRNRDLQWDCIRAGFDIGHQEKTLALFACTDPQRNVKGVSCMRTFKRATTDRVLAHRRQSLH
jgi:hypothetical protein